MRTSVVFRSFLALVMAATATVLAQRGQVPAPVPSGQGTIAPLAPDAMFTVAVAMPVVEAAPIHIADQGPSGAAFRVVDGGVRTVALRGAHAAGNATTQEARLLGIRRTDPCLIIVRRTVNRDIPITLVRLVHPGARYRLEGQFSP